MRPRTTRRYSSGSHVPDDLPYDEHPLSDRVQHRQFQRIKCWAGYHVMLKSRFADERHLHPICMHCGDPIRIRQKPQ